MPTSVFLGGGGGGEPAGENTQVQYNNAGAFGASSNLAFTDDLVGGNVILSLSSVDEAIAQITGNALGVSIQIDAADGDEDHPGGEVSITGGNSQDQEGGEVIIVGGSDSAEGNGGALTLRSGGSTDGESGEVNLRSGDSATWDSGDIYILTGLAGRNRGNIQISGRAVTVIDVSGTHSMEINASGVNINGKLKPNLPTVNPNTAGQLWNDGGTVKVSAG